MAIDTAAKRFSILGFGNPTIKHVLPSGSLGLSSRTTLVDLYSGIILGVLPIIQKQWDYASNVIKTLQLKTSVKSLEIKVGC